MASDLADPEDAKLLVLARAHRARVGSTTGAAVRDSDGRTYSAADVDLPSLQLSAIQLAVAVAVSSGVPGLEAVVLVGGDPGDRDVEAVRDVAGSGVPVHSATADGQLMGTLTT